MLTNLLLFRSIQILDNISLNEISEKLNGWKEGKQYKNLNTFTFEILLII